MNLKMDTFIFVSIVVYLVETAYTNNTAPNITKNFDDWNEVYSTTSVELIYTSYPEQVKTASTQEQGSSSDLRNPSEPASSPEERNQTFNPEFDSQTAYPDKWIRTLARNEYVQTSYPDDNTQTTDQEKVIKTWVPEFVQTRNPEELILTSDPVDIIQTPVENTNTESLAEQILRSSSDELIRTFGLNQTPEELIQIPKEHATTEGSTRRSDRIPLYLMGFSSINVNANGWSSAGVIPAIEMAISDINANDHILREYELVLELKDSQCNPGKAIQGFYEHISSEPTKIIILGGGCSVATVPVARTAPYFGLVQMAYSAASPELSQRGVYPTFFRTAMSDLAINKPIVNLLLHYNWMHIATIHEQDDMFSMTVNQLHYMLSEANITLLTAESFQVTPVENIRNIIAYRQNVYGARYQWLIPGWYNGNWAEVNDTRCTPQQVKLASMYALTLTDLKGDLSGLKTISGMTYSEYLDRYSSWPSTEQYGHNGYHPNGYDAVWAIALALNITDTIISSSNTTEFVNGTFQTRPKRLDDFEYGDSPEISAVIFASMTEITFHGVSGPVAFNLGERSAIVEVQQLQESGSRRVAIYTEESGRLVFGDESMIKWHGDGPPKSALEPAFVLRFKNSTLVICACVLAGVGTVLAVLFLIFNIVNKEHAHIKMSSPRLNNIIVFGVILGFCSVVLLGMDLQFVSTEHLIHICTVRKWVISTSFTFAFGAMFAKTWRVHVIFTRKFTLVQKPIHDVHLIGFVAVLLLLDVAILTAWTVVNPYELKYRNLSEEAVNDFRLVYQMAYCTSENKWWWTGTMYVVKGILLIFGCFLAWETRNVKIPGFNDSKYIGLCVYNVVIMCVVGVAVSVALPDKELITYAFQAFCLLFCTYTTLFVLFLPKILYVVKHPEESAKNRKATKYDGSTPSSTFSYTIGGMKRKGEVFVVQNEGSAGDSLETTDINSSIIEEKNRELMTMRRKYETLTQTLKDLFGLSTEIRPKWGSNGALQVPNPHVCEVHRNVSYSFRRNTRGYRSFDEREMKREFQEGFENRGFC